jgi:cell division protein FtsW (lipid II flippase)
MINATYLGVSGNWVIRPSSIGTGPGSAAMMEFIGAGLLLGLASLERRGPRQILLLTGAALTLGGILLAATRIIWLMTAIAAVTFVLLLGRRRIRWGVSVVLLVAVAWQLSLFFSGGEIIARFQTLKTPFETYRTQRFGALQVLPEVISDYPFGAGVGWNVPRRDLVEHFYLGESVQHVGVHNYFSVLALEVGIVGLLLFLAFSAGVLLRGLLAAHRTKNEARRSLLVACYAIFAGIALSFPFGGGIIGWPGEYYWILAAMVLRLGRQPVEVRLDPSLTPAALPRF